MKVFQSIVLFATGTPVPVCARFLSTTPAATVTVTPSRGEVLTPSAPEGMSAGELELDALRRARRLSRLLDGYVWTEFAQTDLKKKWDLEVVEGVKVTAGEMWQELQERTVTEGEMWYFREVQPLIDADMRAGWIKKAEV